MPTALLGGQRSCSNQQLDDAAVLEVVPCYLARNLCSQLDRAAAGALALLGIFAGVSREWRDAVREAIGNEIGNLGPQKVAGSWESLRRAPWALQLRLSVRRVRLLEFGAKFLRVLRTCFHLRFTSWRCARGLAGRWAGHLPGG